MVVSLTEKKIDVIVIGAGISGVCAAITIAKAKKKVLLVERGAYAGSKNMFGGAIYEYPTSDIFPNFIEDAPIERINKEHKYILADDKSSVSISFKTNQETKSYTVIRAKWDRWCVEQAIKEGVYFSPNTLVDKLIVENNKVIGIETENDKFYSDIVIIADGANSLLTKQIALRKEYKPNQFVLGIKEVIKLPKQTIEDRFNLQDKTGCITEIIGGPLKGLAGLGYIYTYQDAISIGIGVSLEDLKKNTLKPYELLNELKEHSTINELIKNGELLEYSAHLIPEFNLKTMPKCYANGVMVVGDAGMFINNIFFEGTNLAMMSGKLAGETAVDAINNQDFSEKFLSKYKKNFEKTSFNKDLKTFNGIFQFVSKRSNTFFKYYLEKINQFFEMFTTSGKIPKSKTYRTFIKNFLIERNIFAPLKDALDVLLIIIRFLR